MVIHGNAFTLFVSFEGYFMNEVSTWFTYLLPLIVYVCLFYLEVFEGQSERESERIRGGGVWKHVGKESFCDVVSFIG